MLGHSGDTSVYVAPTSELENLGTKALSAYGVGCRANQEDPDFAFSAHCVKKHHFPSVQFLRHYSWLSTSYIINTEQAALWERLWHCLKGDVADHKPVWKDGLSVSSVPTPRPEKGCIRNIWEPFIPRSPADFLFSAQG